jgi:hypothetical protein
MFFNRLYFQIYITDFNVILGNLVSFIFVLISIPRTYGLLNFLDPLISYMFVDARKCVFRISFLFYNKTKPLFLHIPRFLFLSQHFHVFYLLKREMEIYFILLKFLSLVYDRLYNLADLVLFYRSHIRIHRQVDKFRRERRISAFQYISRSYFEIRTTRYTLIKMVATRKLWHKAFTDTV